MNLESVLAHLHMRTAYAVCYCSNLQTCRLIPTVMVRVWLGRGQEYKYPFVTEPFEQFYDNFSRTTD